MSDSIGKIHRHLDNEIGHIFLPKKKFFRMKVNRKRGGIFILLEKEKEK
jgi:hypothetical protein